MRKQLLVLVALVGALAGSLPARASDKIKTYLRGVVSRADGQSFTLYKQGGARTPIAKANVAGGRFDLQTELSQPGFFVFTTSDSVIGELNVFLSPGDDVTLSVEQDKVVMRGKGSGINQFLFHLAQTHGYTAQTPAEEVYKARINAINAATNAEVVRRKALLLGYAQGEFLDKVYGPFMASKVHNNSGEINEPGFAGTDMTLLPGIVYHHNWRQTVTELLMARLQAGQLKVRSITTWVADFAKAIDNQSLREDFIVEQLKNSVSQGDYVLIKDVIKEALPLVKDPAKINAIKQLNGRMAMGRDLYKNALPGTDMSAFTFLRPDGSQVALSDYKGKYVFIDVWATWCKPCVAEIPFLKRLEKEMHGQDIEFVSLSVDGQPDAWKNFLAKRQLTGEQLITKSSSQDPFSVKIGLGGIPRFLILDKEGRMVNYNCCQRPSNPLLKTYLSELLHK